MFIKSINWINEEALEAEVTVSDNHIDILCFSHPFKKNIGETLTDPIYCLDVGNVILSDEEITCANRNNSTFGYLIRGKLINKESKLVLLGNIELCLEDAYIPDSIPEHCFIEFDVSRFDLY